MNIGFITDTNILKKNEREINNDSYFFNNVDFFIDYIDSLERTSSDMKLIYYMPNIIVEELYYQKLSTFKARYDAFCETYKEISYGLNGRIPKCNIEHILKEEKGKYKDKIKFLNLSYNKRLFKELVDEALQKKPPFDKTAQGKKTDAGYKDALIWKSIIYSKKIDECEKLYFFSGDKIFENNKDELNEEFQKFHPNIEFEIVYCEMNGTQRQECLKKIISDNDLIETEIVKLYDLKLVLNYIKKCKYKYKANIYYDSDNSIIIEDIIFKEFSRDDFDIVSVKEDNGKYMLKVGFYTEKYLTSNELIFSTISKKKIQGDINFIFIKQKNKFILEKYSIDNIRISKSISEIISSLANKLAGIVKADIKENVLKSLSDSIMPLDRMKLSIPVIQQYVPSLSDEIKRVDNYNQIETLKNYTSNNKDIKRLANSFFKMEENKEE